MRCGTALHDVEVETNLGTSTTSVLPTAADPPSGWGVPQSPVPARRGPGPGWRDPRLWLGLLLVATSVLAGARIVGSADATTLVWAAKGDLGAGARLEADDLVASRVRFADDADLHRYLTVDDALPPDAELLRSLGAGELVPRAAIGAAGAQDTLQVPLAVDSTRVPGSVTSGSVIDVYVVAGGQDSGEVDPAEPALASVTVLEAPALDAGFTVTGQRQLVVAVPEPAARQFFALIAGPEMPQLTVVSRG